jgi:hypothetical protein
MKFIEINNKELKIDDSDINTKSIIEAFGTLIKKNGFDKGPVACGVLPSPDFGYFELADRFWRASLCIYSFGATNCFWERGVGYAEPWLFNARHAIELFIKGFLLDSIWLEELQSSPHLSVEKDVFVNLRSEFNKPHNLLNLYNDYLTQISNVISNWNTGEIPEIPEITKLTLPINELELLKELAQSDESSFRFRYPSLKQGNLDSLQKINWQHDPSMIFPKTGLPKEAGYFFDHVFVINHLHELIIELKAIETYFRGIHYYQSAMNDFWHEYMSQFSDEGFYF